MITPPKRGWIRRRPFLYSTAVALCGVTFALLSLSVVGYDRYQQLLVKASTATNRTNEVEAFLSNMGLLTSDGDLRQLTCIDTNAPIPSDRADFFRTDSNGFCGTTYESDIKNIISSTDIIFLPRSQHLHFVSSSGQVVHTDFLRSKHIDDPESWPCLLHPLLRPDRPHRTH
jgi:hypothetical protein